MKSKETRGLLRATAEPKRRQDRARIRLAGSYSPVVPRAVPTRSSSAWGTQAGTTTSGRLPLINKKSRFGKRCGTAQPAWRERLARSLQLRQLATHPADGSPSTT